MRMALDQEDPSDGSIEKCPYDFDYKKHKYVKKNVLVKSVVYYCFYYRNRKLGFCKDAELRIPRDKNTGEVLYDKLVVSGKHNFACCKRNGVCTDEYNYLEKDAELANAVEKENLTPKKAKLAHIPKNLDEVMRIRTREIATDAAYRTTPAVDIWAIVKKEMDDKYESWTSLHRDQVMNLVKNTRTELNQGNAIAMIEDTPDYYLMKDSKTAFFRYHASVPNPDDETKPMMRIMAFGNPELLRLLKGRNLDLYMDATFDCCPHPFQQCLIIMMYEPTCSYYVPVMYILMTNKNETCYWHAFNQVVIQSQWTLNVKTYTSDFERALMNQAKHQFGADATHVGCLFHLKQAWRRYLLGENIQMPETDVTRAMKIGVLDLLCVIPRDEIVTYGIPFLREKLEKEADADTIKKWDIFWKYFDYWLSIIPSWNICEENGEYIELTNRTNNALERYNRRINELFKDKKPPRLIEFVQICEKESRFQAEQLRQIREGKRLEVERDEATIPEIDPEYYIFKERTKKTSTTTTTTTKTTSTKKSTKKK